MPTILEVMTARLGTEEVPGKKNNPAIVQWFADCGRSDVQDDETANCAACIGSAAVKCGLPTPAPNSVLMARSWETWGAGVRPDQAQPGDLTIWPRKGAGAPSWQGHINVIETITGSMAVCIGANQARAGKPDAVTRAKPRDVNEAYAIRRAVPATVADLRPHSDTIKQGDGVQATGGIMAFFAMVWAAVGDFLQPATTLPEVHNLPETMSLTQSLMEGGHAVVRLVMVNPWLAGVGMGAVALFGIGHFYKRRRVAAHAAGVPIAGELRLVAELAKSAG